MRFRSDKLSKGSEVLILRSEWMYSPQTGLRMNYELVIQNGMITAVRPQQAALGDRVVELGNAMILPGFVNAHTHLEYTAFADMIDSPHFFTWIRKLLELRKLMSAEDYYVSSLYGAVQSLRSGTTALGDVSYSDTSPRAIADMGLEATVYLEFTAMPDMVALPFDEELNRRIKSLELDIHGSHVKLGLSAHSLYTVPTAALMPMVRTASKKKLPFCIHLCESTEEMSLLVSQSGPYSELYRQRGIKWPIYQPTPVQALNRRGFFNHEPTLIHGVHLEETDMETLQQHHAPIVHCPRSNEALSGGQADTDLWNRYHLNWALGTDSAASSGDLDMWSEMRAALLANPLLSTDELFEAASGAGGTAIHLDEPCGQIAEGHIASLSAIDLDRVTSISDDPMYDVVSQGCSILNRLTMVRGDILYLNSEIMRPIVDVGQVVQQWAELRRRLHAGLAEMEAK